MFWKNRKRLKRARELLAGTRKLLRMHRDILDPKRAEEMSAAADNLQAVIAARNIGALSAACEKLEKQLDKTFPRPQHAAIHENAEVLLVALIVAMGVRTFFVQPFKIPTGSMQPTLYGIVPAEDCDRNVSFVKRFWDGIVSGKWPQRPNGALLQTMIDFLSWTVLNEWSPGNVCVFSGDHIFVDKITYHFRRPRRGEVVVFDTQTIKDRRFNRREDAYYDRDGDAYLRRSVRTSNEPPQRVQELPPDCYEIRPGGAFYIKRLVAIGGDRVQLKPPFLYMNDNLLDDRPAFRRIYSMKGGYNGYTLQHYNREDRVYPQPQFLNNNVSNSYVIPDKHLLVLGDNSTSSLDARFWGPLPQQAVIGKAFLVYWPFTKRFGPVS